MNATLINEKERHCGLRGQVILCWCVLVFVCAHMDKIIRSISVLFEVGGLDGSIMLQLLICNSEVRTQIFRVSNY